VWLKALALLTFIFGVVVGLLWILIEAVGAVAKGSDWIWYLALAATAVPAILFVIAALRFRTRAALVLTVSATVLLGGVVLTYPTDSAACTPATEQVAGEDAAVDGLEDGALLEDEDVDEADAGNCP
jgi:hypothetical protein